MAVPNKVQSWVPTDEAGAAGLSWEEQRLWSRQGLSWRPVYGSLAGVGFSVEWQQFRPAAPVDWGRSFHPGSVEVCLNLEGTGTVGEGASARSVAPQSVGYYWVGREGLKARREAGQSHAFFSVEFTPGFLQRHLAPLSEGLDPVVAQVVAGQEGGTRLGPVRRLTTHEIDLVRTLQKPPVFAAAQPAWYLGKVLELAASVFYQPPEDKELFCHRQQHVAAERVEQVIELLKANLTEPLSLAEIGRRVGCSPFYLSRTFSKETGTTLPQFLRQLRMEKAAELLRSGQYNVTEAAMEVGYSSLSHFSHTFHQTFGCCPGLYPVLKR